MSHPHHTQSFSTRISEIKRLCSLARLVAQADSISLDLHPGAWAGLAEPLIAAGVLTRLEPSAPVSRMDSAAPFRLMGQIQHNSDTLTVAVPVLALDGTAMGNIVLHQARPDALSAALSAQLKQIAQLLAARLVADTVQDQDLPLRMLALIEALAERDTEAGSRVVTGFLRLVAGSVPSTVEATRLCIAGLAEPVAAGTTMPHPSGLRLTAEAGRILSGIGLLAALPLSHDLLPDMQGSANLATAPVPELHAFRAIANLSLGKLTFDIGESADETLLAYRAAGSKGDWTVLVCGLADGWPEIATEIMLAGKDAVKDYVFTHMIHERQNDTATERAYSLYDLNWRIRLENGAVQAAFSQGETGNWISLPVAADAFADAQRDLAFAGLQALVPDLGNRISGEVRAWLRRLATGATVVPIFMPQSA